MKKNRQKRSGGLFFIALNRDPTFGQRSRCSGSRGESPASAIDYPFTEKNYSKDRPDPAPGYSPFPGNRR